jgi:hypothetical protein
VNCLLNCDNERDRSCNLSASWGAKGNRSLATKAAIFCRTTGENPGEAGGDNRSVMPLDVLGCTRTTMRLAESGAIANLLVVALGREAWEILETAACLG